MMTCSEVGLTLSNLGYLLHLVEEEEEEEEDVRRGVGRRRNRERKWGRKRRRRTPQGQRWSPVSRETAFC